MFGEFLKKVVVGGLKYVGKKILKHVVIKAAKAVAKKAWEGIKKVGKKVIKKVKEFFSPVVAEAPVTEASAPAEERTEEVKTTEEIKVEVQAEAEMEVRELSAADMGPIKGMDGKEYPTAREAWDIGCSEELATTMIATRMAAEAQAEGRTEMPVAAENEAHKIELSRRAHILLGAEMDRILAEAEALFEELRQRQRQRQEAEAQPMVMGIAA